MKVDIRQIKGEPRRFHFSESAEELDIDVEGAKFPFPVEVEFTGTLSGDELICEMEIEAEAELECSRCLEIFNLPLSTRQQFVVQISDALRPEDVEDDDFMIIPTTQTELDIGPRVREAVILSLPIKPLCSHNCKGLCPMCGINLNESACDCVPDKADERWDVLKRLFNNQAE